MTRLLGPYADFPSVCYQDPELAEKAATQERPGRFMLQALPKAVRKKFGEESAAVVQRALETMLLESL
jgi:hypothetical protein